MDFHGFPFHGDCYISSCWIRVLTCTHRSRSLSPNIPVLHKTSLCQAVKIPWVYMSLLHFPETAACIWKLGFALSNAFLGVPKSTRTFFGRTCKLMEWLVTRRQQVVTCKDAFTSLGQNHELLWHRQFNPQINKLHVGCHVQDKCTQIASPSKGLVLFCVILFILFDVLSMQGHPHSHSFICWWQEGQTAGVWDFKTMDWRLQGARIKISKRHLVAGSKSKHIRICWSFGLLQHLTSEVRQAGILAIVKSLIITCFHWAEYHQIATKRRDCRNALFHSMKQDEPSETCLVGNCHAQSFSGGTRLWLWDFQAIRLKILKYKSLSLCYVIAWQSQQHIHGTTWKQSGSLTVLLFLFLLNLNSVPLQGKILSCNFTQTCRHTQAIVWISGTD